MLGDLARYIRLSHALWRGDLTRSITGSRGGSTVVEIMLATAVAGWVAFAAISSTPGAAAVSVSAQIGLVDDLALGCALVSSCVVCVLTVLMPPSRQVETMLVTVPLPRSVRRVGQIIPVLTLGVAAGPVVLAPLLATSMQLSGPLVGALVMTVAVMVSAGSVLAAAAVVRALAWAGGSAGWGGVATQTLASAGTLCVSVVVVLALREVVPTVHTTVGIPSAPDLSLPPLVAVRVACAVVFAALAGVLFGSSTRLDPPDAVGIVRSMSRVGRRFATGRPTRVDALLWLRNPAAVSTLSLISVLVVTAATALRVGAPWAGPLGFALVTFVPCGVGLVHYGTDRSIAWRRNAARPHASDRWQYWKVVQGLVAGVLSAGATVAALAPAPVGEALSLGGVLLVSASAGVLAGVIVPSDLELPGAQVVAATIAAALVGVPSVLLPLVIDGSWSALALLAVAVAYAVAAPFLIGMRRRRAITA